MSTELVEAEDKDASNTPDEPTGVRPMLKIGGKLGFSTSPDSEENPAKKTGEWAFEYRPGDKKMNVIVRTENALFLAAPPMGGEMSMTVDSQGIEDLIAWLYGVKNSISSSK